MRVADERFGTELHNNILVARLSCWLVAGIVVGALSCQEAIIIKEVSRVYRAYKSQIVSLALLVDRCTCHLAKILQDGHSPLSFPRAILSVELMAAT